MPRSAGTNPPRHNLRAAILIAATAFASTACTAPIPNPSFDISINDAQRELADIPKDSVHFERPIVVAAGFMDPGIGAASLANRFRRIAANPDMIVEVPFLSTRGFERSRARLINKLEDAFPNPEPETTVEVDVIGISMGGLVARYAAIPVQSTDPIQRKRLRINRLFTLGTPHHGAVRANSTPPFDPRVIDMRPGSDFLQRVNNAWEQRDYQLIAYTRLGDSIVGVENALDPDGTGYWLATPPLSFPHLAMQNDPRILADIIRRLRAIPPIADQRPAPLPIND